MRLERFFDDGVLLGHRQGFVLFVETFGLLTDFVLFVVFVTGRTPQNALGPFRREDTGLTAARRRHAGVLVFVVRVARGASRLLHVLADHRDDDVIRDAALTRAIVVKNVTEPKPALLHSRLSFLPSGGILEGEG
jgi:hypothetical protein